MLEKIVDIARCLVDLHNMSSLFGIVCGLNFFSVERLKKTWAGVSKKKQEVNFLRKKGIDNLFSLSSL